LDTIPNMTLTTTERMELLAEAAAFKAVAAVSTDYKELMERVQQIADKIDAQQKRGTSMSKWGMNVVTYAIAEFKKRFSEV
jgi:hypothetical protein